MPLYMPSRRYIPPVAALAVPAPGGGSGGGGGGVSVVTQGAYNNAATTDNAVAFPTTGVVAGDILIFTHFNVSGFTSPVLKMQAGAGVTLSNIKQSGPDGREYSLYARTLTSADISSGVIQLTSGGVENFFQFIVVRGATSANFAGAFSYNNPETNTLTMAGFAPSTSPASLGVLFFGNALSGGPVTITGPSGWTSTVSTLQNFVVQAEVWHRLTGYTNAPATWSGWGASGTYNIGYFVELT